MLKLLLPLLLTAAAVSGQSTTPSSCCKTKVYDGKNYKYVGVDATAASTTGCNIPGSCIYTLDDGTGDQYCWKSAAGPKAACIEQALRTDTTVEEDGNVFVQTTEYNEDTGQIRIQVPGHGSNDELDVYMESGSDVMVVVSGDTCQIQSVPDKIDTSEAGTNSLENATVTTELETKDYTLVVDEGPASQADIDSMPAGSQCEGKSIRKTSQKTISKAEYDRIVSGEPVSYEGKSSQSRMKRQASCVLKRKCASKGNGCFRSSFGGNSVSLHSLAVDVVCVDCCESGSSPDYCNCSDINSVAKLQECSKPTNGSCLEGFTYCNGTCLLQKKGLQINCDGSCPNNRIECGKYCIPKSWGNWMWPCGDSCQSKWKQCNGVCSSGYKKCGTRCILSTYFDKYYTECGQVCQSKSTPCNGVCEDGYKKCGSRCIMETTYERYYWTCTDGTCQGKWKPCNNLCPTDYKLCQSKFGTTCIQETYFKKYYRDCDGVCQSKWQPCKNKCLDNYTLCGKSCLPTTYYEKYYQKCNEQCIGKWQKCNGACATGLTPCGNRCIETLSFNLYYQNCNGVCLRRWQTCTSTSSAGPASTASTTPGGTDSPATSASTKPSGTDSTAASASKATTLPVMTSMSSKNPVNYNSPKTTTPQPQA